MHDAEARTEDITLDFRRNLIKRQIKEQNKDISVLKQRKDSLLCELKNLCNNDLRYDAFVSLIERIVEIKRIALNNKHNEKLSKLYGGPVVVKEPRDILLNLSRVTVPQELESIFDLGMNCHLRSKYNMLEKKIEIEKLYRSIQDKVTRREVSINNNERLKCELKRFGLRQITDFTKYLLTKEQYKQLRDFINNEEIIVRKGDKSNVFVIMNRNDYNRKIDALTSDPSKFIPVTKDPTPQLKKKLRSLLDIVHAKSSAPKLPVPVGQYHPGYVYGNAKIHKNKLDPPLRPIISQLGTPTYEIAKRLNEIITPYIPSKYMIKSTHEFIEIVREFEGKGTLASLDVESLFTNVPVQQTINIILDVMYNNPTIAAPDIPQDTMKALLVTCTTETPFRIINGDIFLQKDGVSMGSPLGPLFANMYMCFVENTVLPTLTHPPMIYTRYVDDIFLVIKDIRTLTEIKEKFEALSVLKFTHEIEQNKIAFLDVKITRKSEKLETAVHTKETDSGECLNYNSICPEKYKIAVIRTFLHRAYKNSSTWILLHTEINRIKQVLSNNNFPLALIENEIERFLNKKQLPDDYIMPQDNNIELYFKNQMSSLYKQEENNLCNIIKENVKPVDDQKKITLRVFYRGKKLRSLILRNNPHKIEGSKRSHVVYKYKCSRQECQPSNVYVGYTECSLEDRFRNHSQNGSILAHNLDKHQHKITASEMLENTEILCSYPTKQELVIAEALLIKEITPALNGQREGETRILNIF